MATTKRRKQKELKLVQEEIKNEVVQEEIKTHLDQGHLLQLETITRDIENAKLLMALEEQSLKNMLLEKMILDNKIEKQKMLLKDKGNYYENLKKGFVNFQKEIWPQYGFSENEGMGYDPISGELKRN